MYRSGKNPADSHGKGVRPIDGNLLKANIGTKLLWDFCTKRVHQFVGKDIHIYPMQKWDKAIKKWYSRVFDVKNRDCPS